MLIIWDRTAIETLLERGFKPTRSVILAFGIDEERGGPTVSAFMIQTDQFDVLLQGAAAIGEYLVNTYGEDSMSMIVDEGGKFPSWLGGKRFLNSVKEHIPT
jgi:Gly-Xaa carboxypeptidase